MRSKSLAILAILEDHFGDIVKDVGGAILTLENPTLPQIFRSLSIHRYNVSGRVDAIESTMTKITMSNIYKALLILYQHNCLNYCIPEMITESSIGNTSHDTKVFLNETTLKTKGFKYSLNEQMILNRVRFSKYIFQVYNTCGILPSLIFEEIIHHGKLQSTHIVDIVRTKISAAAHQDRLVQQGGRSVGPTILSSLIYSENDQLAFREFINIHSDFFLNTQTSYSSSSSSANKNNDKKLGEMNILIWQACQQLIKHQFISSFNVSDIISTSTLKNNFTNENSKTKRSSISSIVTADTKSIKMKISTGTSASVLTSTSNGSKASTTIGAKRGRGRNQVTQQSNSSASSTLPVELTFLSDAVVGTNTHTTNTDHSPSKRLRSNSNSSSSSNINISNSYPYQAPPQLIHPVSSLETMNSTRTKRIDLLQRYTDDSVKKIYWCLNWNRFYITEKFQLCEQLIRERMGSMSGEIIKMMLDLTLAQTQYTDCDLNSYEKLSMRISSVDLYQHIQFRGSSSNSNSNNMNKNKSFLGSCDDENTVTVSSSSISTGTVTNNILSVIDIDKLNTLMEMMRYDSLKLLIKGFDNVASSSNHNSSSETVTISSNLNIYAVNVYGILNYLKQRAVHSIVSERYCEASGRITQLLLKRHDLDQQRIGDTVIIPPRDARLQLYSLYKDGWIDVSEISKKSDFNPASTIYHWQADEKQMIITAVELIYKSIINLRLRRKSEYEKTYLYCQTDVATMNDLEKIKQSKLVAVLRCLDQSLVKLYDTLMLLS